MEELKSSSATVYKLGSSPYGLIKIRIRADSVIDIIITGEKNTEYFLKKGEFLKGELIYHKVKDNYFDKSINTGSKDMSLIIINQNPNSIKYSIDIDEIELPCRKDLPISNVMGYTGPGYYKR